MSNLAGFYPPKDQDIWNPDILWQPIPVHTTPAKMDKVLYAGKPCPRYDYLHKKYLETPEHRQLNKKYKKVFEYLTENSGKTVNSMKTVLQLYSCMNIERIHNKILPNWTVSVFPSPMDEISAISFQTATATREMARLQTGPLVREILDRFQNKSTNKLSPDRSIWVYSAHDTTVADLLNTLRLYDPPFNPPFTALILMELRVRGGNPFVSIFYKNGITDQTGTQLEIPGCGLQCPLDKMFELYADIIPSHWDEECRLNTLSLSYEDAEVGSYIGEFCFSK